jgi:hypothetical protein
MWQWRDNSPGILWLSLLGSSVSASAAQPSKQWAVEVRVEWAFVLVFHDQQVHSLSVLGRLNGDGILELLELGSLKGTEEPNQGR